jgi:hypothetical protein
MLMTMNRYLVEVHAAMADGDRAQQLTDVTSRLAEHGDVLSDPEPKVLGEDVADHLVLQFTIEANNENSGDAKGRKIARDVLDVGDAGDGDDVGLTLVSARAVDWEPSD